MLNQPPPAQRGTQVFAAPERAHVQSGGMDSDDAAGAAASQDMQTEVQLPTQAASDDDDEDVFAGTAAIPANPAVDAEAASGRGAALQCGASSDRDSARAAPSSMQGPAGATARACAEPAVSAMRTETRPQRQRPAAKKSRRARPAPRSV